MDTELNVDAELRVEFVDESLDLLADLESLFIKLEHDPDDPDTVQAIFRPIHSVKGNSSFFDFHAVKNLSHEMETLLDLVRKKALGVTPPMVSALLDGTDALRVMLRRGRNNAPEIEDRAAYESLVDRVKAIARSEVTVASLCRSLVPRLRTLQGEFGATNLSLDVQLVEILQQLTPHIGEPDTAATQAPAASPATPVSAEPPTGAEPATEAKANVEKKGDEPGKTMRVSEQHVDTFLAFVGELLVVGDMFNDLASRMENKAELRTFQTTFRRIIQTFEKLSSELQTSIMSIRLVSVKGLLQRVPRIVRDVTANSRKEIDVQIEGEHIEVDKSLIDLMDAPLTHMVRNAADHGIELTESRLAAGKPPAGCIRVCIEEHGGSVSLVVEDDGAGLDFDAIQRKATAIGLVPEGKALTHQDVVDFLFCSGVSTADEVTDVSGRGVGMDVVKRMVEDAGGTIQVSSVPTEGTRFEISVPKSVTTQIVPGFLVEAAGQRFVFPMSKVLETVRVNLGDIHDVPNQGRCFTHHGEILTILGIKELLQLEGAGTPQRDYELVVVLSTRSGSFAAAVDDALGLQKVVLRRIRGLPELTEAIAGGALMGDGSVALILDVDKLRGERGR